MSKWLRFSAVLFSAAVISGCAIIDTTMQETAVPRDTTGFEIVAYCGNGVPIYSKAYFGNEKDEGDGWLGLITIVMVGSVISSTVDGVKVNIPVIPQTDFVGQLYTTGYGSSWGGRLGIKHLLRKDVIPRKRQHSAYNSYLSVLPTIHYSYQGGENSRNLSGVGCQLLWSWFEDRNGIFTLGLSGSYDKFSIMNYENKSTKRFKLYHGGINLNYRATGDVMSITPEIGIEVYPGIDDPVYLAPFVNIGFGFN